MWSWKTWAVAVVVVALGYGVPAGAAVQYTITDLGTLGGVGCSALGLNNAGQVIGVSQNSDGAMQWFVWQNGTMTAFPMTGQYSITDINDRGQVVGYARTPSGPQGFLWDNGAITWLGSLAGRGSLTGAINEAGQIAGYAAVTDYLGHAFVYQGGVMQDLGTLGGQGSWATDINNRGQIIGQSGTVQGGGRGFLYRDGAMTDLGTLNGFPFMPNAINDGAQIAGSVHTGQQDSFGYDVAHAAVWQNGQIVDLGALDAVGSNAFAINTRGEIVGRLGYVSTDLGGHALLYRDGVMSDLNDLIDSGTGWVLAEASAINDRGTIVGNGSINGHDRAFLLTPVPEPISLMVFAVGMCILLHRERVLVACR
jgi:probable HAF family extracellular repeat protein